MQMPELPAPTERFLIHGHARGTGTEIPYLAHPLPELARLVAHDDAAMRHDREQAAVALR